MPTPSKQPRTHRLTLTATVTTSSKLQLGAWGSTCALLRRRRRRMLYDTVIVVSALASACAALLAFLR